MVGIPNPFLSLPGPSNWQAFDIPPARSLFRAGCSGAARFQSIASGRMHLPQMLGPYMRTGGIFNTPNVFARAFVDSDLCVSQ